MEICEQDITGAPAENLHVAPADFAAVWRAAEVHWDGSDRDMYDAGVAQVCRWLARSPVRLGRGPAGFTAPVTGTPGMAMPELIEPEAIAAEVLAFADPRPQWVLDRFDWIDAVHATFAWAWRGASSVPWPPPAAVRRPPGRRVGV